MILSSERKWGVIFPALLLFPSVLAASIFTVVNNNSSGPGSLAQAVEDANAHGEEGPQTVAFAIPGPGVHKIDLRNTGLSIGDSITIDGYTQPGTSPNTLSVGNNAVILIQLDGEGLLSARYPAESISMVATP